MNTSASGTAQQDKVGGLAALYLGAAYVVAMPFFLVFVKYMDVVDPVEKVNALIANHDSMRIMNLITYVVFGIVLAVLALSLHARLRRGAPALSQAATVVGCIWAAMLVASGLTFNAGMAAVVDLHATSPAQAVSAWRTIEPVADGLGGSGGELLGRCSLCRAGSGRLGEGLRVAADRVVRVVGDRHAAHSLATLRSGRPGRASRRSSPVLEEQRRSWAP